MIASLVTGQSFLIRRNRSRQMVATLKRLMQEEKFDVVHIDQVTMAEYSALGRAAGAKIVLDLHDVVSDLVRRIAGTTRLLPGARFLGRYEARKLAAFERWACSYADLVFAVTERDRRLIKELNRSSKPVATVPISIDCFDVRMLPRPAQSRQILTVGTLFYPPNANGIEWFLRRVYPMVKSQIRDVNFVAAGQRPPRQLRLLASEDPTVSLPGYVTEDQLRQLVATSAVMIVPIRAGGGMRVKILHAFACGIPVVSTTLGCEGIEARSGMEILLADEPAGFAEAIVSVISSLELARRMASRARKLAVDKYDRRVGSRQVESAYELVASR